VLTSALKIYQTINLLDHPIACSKSRRYARTHSDAQVAQIAGSIREFGFTNPVLVDGENGIVAGHGRVLAAHLLRMTEVPRSEIAYLTDAQRKKQCRAPQDLHIQSRRKPMLGRHCLRGTETSQSEFRLAAIDVQRLHSAGSPRGKPLAPPCRSARRRRRAPLRE
jgi:hypothetical protein